MRLQRDKYFEDGFWKSTKFYLYPDLLGQLSNVEACSLKDPICPLELLAILKNLKQTNAWHYFRPQRHCF